MSSIRDGVADVVFLDPPFNLGKDYGRQSDIEVSAPDQYDAYMRHVLSHCVRILAPGGALFLYQLPTWAVTWAGLLREKLQFRNWIAISMKNGFARGSRLYPAHYALLYLTKGDPARFARPRLKVRRCPHCDHVIKDYGGYRMIVEDKGINLSDVWDDLSPVRHKSNKLRGTNQLPVELTDRVCAIAGGKGLLLVDPFVGTGTSLVSARRYGMHFIGNDVEPASIKIALKRLSTECVDRPMVARKSSS